MNKISTGISDLDKLIDFLHEGDNIVWEVKAGTSYEAFVFNFIRESLSKNQNIIYVSFNKSPQSIYQQNLSYSFNKINKFHLSPLQFILLDCFTSGKGNNDKTFIKFYENNTGPHVIKVEKPGNITQFTNTLNSLEDRFPAPKYIFDSLTGMQDLWGEEDNTYKFFTYMYPPLYDPGTEEYPSIWRSKGFEKAEIFVCI